jgi:hypothetical protein
LLRSLLPLQPFFGILCALPGVVDSLLIRGHGFEKFETSALPKPIAFACAMRMPLLASASTQLVASARGFAVGGAAGMGASSMPLAFFTQKVLNEPANAGSTRARSAMFDNRKFQQFNANFSDLTAF